MRMQNDSPCDRDCQERSSDPNCHSYCKRYEVWQAKKKREREERRSSSAWTKAKTGAYCKGPHYKQKKETRPLE